MNRMLQSDTVGREHHGSVIRAFDPPRTKHAPPHYSFRLVARVDHEPIRELPLAPMTNADLRGLHHELQLCQRRLGTPAELPGDFERVLQLAHEINNQITVDFLRESTDSRSPLSLFALCKRRLFG
jgi:hypothetical protein